MVVLKQIYGSTILISGTVQEIAEQLNADQVPEIKFKIFYNGTNVSAIYKMK